METSLPHFDVMNRDQSRALEATCGDDGNTARASYITAYSHAVHVTGGVVGGHTGS